MESSRIPKSIYRQINVDPVTLNRLEWRSVCVSTELSAVDIARLMAELKSEDVAHTWREFEMKSAQTVVEDLKSFEQQKRPTRILGYFGIRENGERVFFGAGAIADKISHAFPYDGFPVISRSYIIKKYRNYRLYAPLVEARSDLCAEHWKDELKGIHLGSANPRVWAAIRSDRFIQPFVYLGNENLKAGGNHVVRDFMVFSKYFENALLEDLSLKQAGSGELFHQVRKLFSNEFRQNDFLKLKMIIENSRVKFSEMSPGSQLLNELLAFFEAIPVLLIETPELETPPLGLRPGDNRRKAA